MRSQHLVRNTLLLVGCVAATTTALAAPQVDQASGPEGPTVGGQFIGINIIGQTFRPSLNALDFVQVQGGILPDNSTTRSRVLLRAGGESGPLIAASSPLSIDDGAVLTRTYLFETPVALNPGDLYYFGMDLLETDSPDTRMVVSIIDHGDPYPGGDLVVNGLVNPGMDLWFREGLMIPEPSPGHLLALGALALFHRQTRMRVRP
jgi:hypothetical protein